MGQSPCRAAVSERGGALPGRVANPRLGQRYVRPFLTFQSTALLESFIAIFCTGLIWSEVKQLWDMGLREYVHDMWNVIDFVTNSLYVATVALRIVSHFQVRFSCNVIHRIHLSERIQTRA